MEIEKNTKLIVAAILVSGIMITFAIISKKTNFETCINFVMSATSNIEENQKAWSAIKHCSPNNNWTNGS